MKKIMLAVIMAVFMVVSIPMQVQAETSKGIAGEIVSVLYDHETEEYYFIIETNDGNLWEYSYLEGASFSADIIKQTRKTFMEKQVILQFENNNVPDSDKIITKIIFKK